MRRKLFTAVSLLSLLLFVATVVLWVRSYGGNEKWQDYRVIEKWLWSMKGSISWYRGTIECSSGITRYTSADADWDSAVRVARMLAERPSMRYERNAPRVIDGPEPPPRGRFGFYWSTYASEQGRWVEFTLPHWSLVVTFGTLPGWIVLRWCRRVHRTAAHRCLICGYSLTGNTSGICPECGTAVAGKAGA